MQNNFLDEFLKAIDLKVKVDITYNSKDKGVITRNCIPFDYGPSQKKDSIDKTPKYHVFSLDGPEKPHNVAISPDKVITIDVTSDSFDPADYVTWQTNWIYPRNWGTYS